MNKTLGVTIGIALLIAVVAGVIWYQSERGAETIDPSFVLHESGEWRPYEPLEPSGETIDATYQCENGTSFATSYDLGSNELTLVLDGEREFVLPQGVSEEGARFALRDGSVVFYEEAGAARVEIGGEVMYQDCVPQL